MDSKFKSIPELKHSEFSAGIENQELTQWLQELLLHDSSTSLIQILCMLQKLAALNVNTETRVSSLEKIRVVLPAFCEKLQASFLDSSFPLALDQQANVEVIVWVHGQLALCYLQTANQQTSKIKQKQVAIILYRCLQELSQALLVIFQVYEQPYEGFWLICYQVYRQAEKLQILDLEITLSGSDKASTIKTVFKQIMVFALSGTNQFRPRDTKKIFLFLANEASPAKIFTEINQESGKGLCRINLESDSPPVQIQDCGDATGAQLRYISPVRIAKKIYQLLKVQKQGQGQGSLQKINQEVLIKLFKTLSLSKSRKFTRVNEERDCSAVIGFNNLNNLLRKDIKDAAGMTDTAYDPRIAGHWRTPELELVVEGDEYAHQMHQTKKLDIQNNAQIRKIFAASKAISEQNSIWDLDDGGQDKPDNEIVVGEFEMLDSSISGYSVLGNEQALKARVGDIFGIVSDSDNRIEVGLIFRINICAEGKLRLGIKLLGMDSRAVLMTKPGDKNSKVWGILIPGVAALKSVDSIVYSSSKFQPGDFVCIQQESGESHCRLNKLIHSTAAISQVELFYQNIGDKPK